MDLIENYSILLENNQTEYMCVFDSNILENISEPWRYNRNLSTEKIHAIIETIRSKSILDTVLHFVLDKSSKLICFDGNHRREALVLLSKKYNINIKVCCYIYILNCDEHDIDSEITKRFKIINQMTPIPDIYNDIIDNLECNELVNRKDIIEMVFEKYKSEYKTFYSVNSKCKRPNFNETTFKDLCNNLQFDTLEQLETELIKFNQNKKKFINNIKKSKYMLAKCQTRDFYIFI